jgi:hypothetical protein
MGDLDGRICGGPQTVCHILHATTHPCVIQITVGVGPEFVH